MTSIPISALPATLRLIAQVTSVEVALALGTAQRESKKLYVPKRYLPGHWITELIGWEMAEKLRKTFGGEQLNVSGGHRLSCAIRRRRMARDYKNKGLRTDQLAAKYGLSIRQAQYAVSESYGGVDRRTIRGSARQKHESTKRPINRLGTAIEAQEGPVIITKAR